MKGLALFWGCTIPARFPFMERSLRSVLDILSVGYQDVDGFTCCPEKSLVKNFHPDLWQVAAARNVAVAEAEDLDIMSPCNGCYGSLRGISSQLRTYPRASARINERLAEIGMAFYGTARVRHLVEFLHDQLGLTKIRGKLVFPLAGLRIAVHPGCHQTRPSGAIHFDDPFKPSKYDTLVAILGAEPVEYKTKMFCCGGYLSRVGMQDGNLAMAATKFKELMELEVDALSTTCPECFKIYDNYQPFLQKKGLKVNLPVLTLPELMGLAFGMTPQELGLEDHRTDCSPFIEKFEAVKNGVML